ncbi:MAG: SusD/RagB family nutrient-binding outer membrane lipoprotein [Bacteroidota bacterium]
MKKRNFKNHWIVKAGVILLLVAFISSCEKWIDPTMNEDPDAPQSVPMSLMVPAIQQTMGFNLMGNNTVRTTNLWMQFYDGIARQSLTEMRYQLNTADVTNIWSNIYTELLNESKLLAEKAVEEGSPHNAGMAKVMTACGLGIATDLFGDIPYSDALKGSENVLKPLFDTQEEIYTSIFSLLDEALLDLADEEDLIGISGDVIYGGDVDAWIAAAHALYARAELQLSKVNGADAYNGALDHIADAIGEGGDMEVPFESANKNPVFQFMEQRTDIRICQTFLDELEANTDPRIPFYVAENDDLELIGSPPASGTESASWPGDYMAAEDASTVLISYAEVKFIEAEALLQTGDAAGAAAAYNAAVLASVAKVTGEDGQTWMDDNNITKNDASIDLESIIMQKRHALVGQVQPFSDWRRTGIPNLTVIAGATKTEIPRRFPYSQDEIIYNEANIPPVGSIIVPVWWDE